MKTPFYTDPDLLAGVEGQQFIVLRPNGDVSKCFDDIKARLQKVLPDKAKYPNTGHVTLRGFSDNGDKLYDAAKQWAKAIKPFVVSAEELTYFPTPFKIIVLKIKSSLELREAYIKLTDIINDRGFKTVGVQRSAAEWIFHMSLAYCANLDDAEWEAVLKSIKSLSIPEASETVHEAEFVWFRNCEHSRPVQLNQE